MLKITQTQKRYRLFDKNSVRRLVGVIKNLSTYTVEGPVKSKIVDIYYDNDKKLLSENNMILRKRSPSIAVKPVGQFTIGSPPCCDALTTTSTSCITVL